MVVAKGMGVRECISVQFQSCRTRDMNLGSLPGPQSSEMRVITVLFEENYLGIK